MKLNEIVIIYYVSDIKFNIYDGKLGTLYVDYWFC